MMELMISLEGTLDRSLSLSLPDEDTKKMTAYKPRKGPLPKAESISTLILASRAMRNKFIPSSPWSLFLLSELARELVWLRF